MKSFAAAVVMTATNADVITPTAPTAPRAPNTGFSSFGTSDDTPIFSSGQNDSFRFGQAGPEGTMNSPTPFGGFGQAGPEGTMNSPTPFGGFGQAGPAGTMNFPGAPSGAFGTFAA